MKLVHITFQFQYAEAIDAILAEHEIRDYVRHPRIAGRDADGKHDNSQAFPGHLASVDAFVDNDTVDALLDALEEFRTEKTAHEHLRAAVMPVDRILPDSS